ncbi:MAG: hypothetical protein ACTJLK_04845 [Anaplasma sp.]
MLGFKKSNSIVKCLLGASVAAVATAFCAKRFGGEEESRAASKKCAELKSALENTAVRQSIMNRRIEEHFALFCTLDSINTKIPEEWFTAANCDTSLRVREWLHTACYVLLGVTVSILLVLGIVRQLSALRAFGKFNNMEADAIIIAAVVLGIVGYFVLRLSSPHYGVCGNAGRIRDAELQRLTDARERNEAVYRRVLESVKRYNALPEHVRYDVRISEYLAALVKERIMSGAFTEKSAAEVEQKVNKLYAERTAVCA